MSSIKEEIDSLTDKKHERSILMKWYSEHPNPIERDQCMKWAKRNPVEFISHVVDFILDGDNGTSHKVEFVEDHGEDSGVLPDSHYHNFDMASVLERLGEFKKETNDRDFLAMTEVLEMILQWITTGKNEKAIFRNAIALAWVVNPAIFEGSPSATKLAKRFKLHKAVLSEHTAEASRIFGFRNRNQKHGWNHKKSVPVHINTEVSDASQN